MNPLKIFIATILALFTVVLMSLLFVAAAAGDWIAFAGGAAGTLSMMMLGVGLLRS